jgi:hypothetical protein
MERIMLDREEDQSAAMEALSPVLPMIYGILDDAVSFYFSDNYSDAARADHDDRAMASCIYSHAEKRMWQAVETVPGLTAIRVQGLLVLNFRDRTLARFKKVRPNGRHSNYQTQQQQDYDDQLPLPGIPEPAYRLTAGYQLDAAGASLDRIMIARPIGRSVLWTAQVMISEGVADWQDITPKRFAGTEATDFDAERLRRENGR